MTLKTALAALVISLTPAVAAAMCGGMIEQTASSCSEGQVWDSATSTCVEPVTG